MDMTTKQVLEPDEMSWVELYRRLVEVVVPRPIALVSTVDEQGRANLAPFSFFNVVSANPPYLAFAPQRSGRTGETKDTLRNVQEVPEFVVSVVTEAIAEQVNRCAAMLPHGESEFVLSGLTSVPASRVRPSLVAESPVNMECRVVDVHTYGDEPGSGSLVVGELLVMHVAEGVRDAAGAVPADLLRAVGRMGGPLWVRTRDVLSMQRP